MQDVVLGVAIADMSDFVAIDPAYGIGDQQRQVEALIAHELDARGVPPSGRPVLVIREFSSIDIEHKRATADAFADDEVLAVLGARDFTYGSVRLAEVHHIPIIDVNAVPRTLFQRTDPWLFTVRAAQDLVYLSYVEWAHATGRLGGRRIGVFSDRYTATSTAAAITRLSEHGYPVQVHVTSDGVGVGSERDTDAARQFADAGVDLIMPFVSGSSLAGLLQAAARMEYRPTLLELETGEHATDVSGSAMPSDIYDGTSALVMTRVGELAAGRPLDADAEQAIRAVEDATGQQLPRRGRASSGAVSNVLLVADLVRILFTGLRDLGPAPTRLDLVESLQRITDLPSASGGRMTFRPNAQWGCREMREIVWRDGEWRVVGEYAPLAPSPA